MENKVYILFESYGSYDERHERPIVAYVDAERAKAKCNQLNEQLEEWRNEVGNILNNNQDIEEEDIDKIVEEITNGRYDYYSLIEQNRYSIKECKLEI